MKAKIVDLQTAVPSIISRIARFVPQNSAVRALTQSKRLLESTRLTPSETSDEPLNTFSTKIVFTDSRDAICHTNKVAAPLAALLRSAGTPKDQGFRCGRL